MSLTQLLTNPLLLGGVAVILVAALAWGLHRSIPLVLFVLAALLSTFPDIFVLDLRQSLMLAVAVIGAPGLGRDFGGVLAVRISCSVL